MLAIDSNDGQTPSAIASIALASRRRRSTKTIGRLAAQRVRAARKLQGRRRNDNDAGVLTDAGRDQIKSVRKSQRRTEKAAFAGLKDKDVAQLLDLLSTVDASIAADLRSKNAGTADRILDPEALEPQENDLPVGDEPVPETD